MKHSRVENRNDNRPIAIAVDGEPLGVLLPEAGAYKFLAVRLNAFGIDGRVFPTAEAAQAAAEETVRRAAAS